VTSARRTPTRRFFGSGKGRFTTKGRYGSATIRGTRWGVQDFCDRTFLGDIEGTVEARDFAKRKTVILQTGQGYIALG
jgi:hypothetical protein